MAHSAYEPLAALQRMADASPQVKKLAKLSAIASNAPVQRLSKQQRENIKSYKLTDDFKRKHVVHNANRQDLMEVAGQRGVAASTLIRAPVGDIEKKALDICQTGDNTQVAAEVHTTYGRQVQVRMTGLERGTITRGAFGGWKEDAFVIVGAWKGKTVSGNHFQATATVSANDEEVLG